MSDRRGGETKDDYLIPQVLMATMKLSDDHCTKE